MSVRVLAFHEHGVSFGAAAGSPREHGAQEAPCLGRARARSCVRALGLSVDDFEDKQTELLVERGWAPPEEVFWGLADDALREARARDNHLAESAILGTMARALYEQGGHHLALQRQAHRAFLRGLSAEGIAEVELDCRCGCPICKPSFGQRWLVADALELLPVPHEGCTETYCQCWWSRGWSADPPSEP